MDIPIIIITVITIVIFIALLYQSHKKDYNRRQNRGIPPIGVGSFVILLNILELFKGRTNSATLWLMGILAILYGLARIYFLGDSNDED